MLETSSHSRVWLESTLIGDRLEQWGENAPQWGPAQRCRKRTEEFFAQTSEKRRRLGMPIIVAMLGGTGTGKSTLINAIVGQQVVKSGNVRPTTHKPTMICRPDLNPEGWGIDPRMIDIVTCDSPALDRLVLLDCPDPDTVDDPTLKESNLAKLRQAAPICDVLLVTGTQQKYRDHRVLDELAHAAPGARLVFVQTHADKDADIRDDWQQVLSEHYQTGKIYFLDSREAFFLAQENESYSGDFAALYELLTNELSEETAIRIREANYVDSAEKTISLCREDLRQSFKSITHLKNEIASERKNLGEKLAEKMHHELKNDRRLWESQLIQEVTSRKSFLPFALVLKIYLLFADLAAFLATFRKRSLMSLAMGKVSDMVPKSPTAEIRQINGLLCWNTIELQKSALSLPGYLNQAGLPEELCSKETVFKEGNEAGQLFLAGLASKVREVCGKISAFKGMRVFLMTAHILLGMFFLFGLFLFGKNLLYDSWHQGELYGIGHYLIFLFWMAVFSAVLVLLFLGMIRRYLDGEVRQVIDELVREYVLDALFVEVRRMIQVLDQFQHDLDAMSEQVVALNEAASELDKRLGCRKIG